VGLYPMRWLRCAVVLSMLCALMALAGAAYATEPIRPMQWYLDSWKIDEAWKLSRGQGITVAVVDTGVNGDHADLQGQVLPSAKTGDSDVEGKGHGTSMAALIAGTGKGASGQGAYGIAPDAKILPYQVPNGTGVLRFQALAQALAEAANSSAQIINVSLASEADPEVARAIAQAQSRGKLVVAGAGNREAPVGNRVYPAAYPGVLGVSSFDRNGTFWTGSYQGDWVSISAPGVDIVSACNGPTGYCKGSGTSNSTALASGVAALVWSTHPDWTANQVIKVLIDSANKPSDASGLDNMLGYGGISPRRALGWTGDPGPPDVNPLVGKRGDPPAASASASATPSAAPSVASAAPAPANSPAPAQAAPSSSGGSSNDLIAIGAIIGGVVVLAALTVVVLRGRRRRPPPAAPGVGGEAPYAHYPPPPSREP
jgi:type VII secretion-associated serine protease mycosin